MSDDMIVEITDIWTHARAKRDFRLETSDWTQMPDSPLSDEKKAEWAEYRKALRDIPQTYSTVTKLADIIFPEKPSA